MRGGTMVSNRNRSIEWTLVGTLVGVAAALLLGVLAGCAGMAKHREEGAGSRTEDARQPVSAPTEVPIESKSFAPPGELDKLLDAKPIAMAPVQPAAMAVPSGAGIPKAAEPANKARGNFRIQVGAESDVDAAQAKKAEYEKLLGGSVDVVFDPPYYKLRWGYFDSKQDAEDKLLELSDYKIQGFVIRQ